MCFDVCAVCSSFKVQPLQVSHVLPIDIWSENIRVAALELVCLIYLLHIMVVVSIHNVLPYHVCSPDLTLRQCGGNLESVAVSLISSNTHSIMNLLSPWVHQNRNKMIEWGI